MFYDGKEQKRQEKHGIFNLLGRFLLADFGSISTQHEWMNAVGNFVVGKRVEKVLLFLPFLLFSSLKHRFLVSCGVFVF